MKKFAQLILAAMLLAAAPLLSAQEAEGETDVDSSEAADVPQGDGIESPKTLSGMSILGNEEAPKALVIIPWKSSELGDDISFSDTLDDRARPVDKEVFERELRYYQIRAGDGGS